MRRSIVGRRIVRGAICVLLCGGAVAPVLAASPEQQMQQMGALVEVMTSYYKLMEQIHSVAADSDKTAIVQMVKLKDYLEQSGQRERVIADLRELSTKHPSTVVRNAAIIMLTDAMNEQGSKRDAAAVLERALHIAAAAQ